MNASHHDLARLRRVLLADAATCLACGALLSPFAAAVAALAGLPPALVLVATLALLPVGVYMAVVALKAPDHAVATGVVIAGNLLWVAGSLWLAAGAAGTPTLLGQWVLVLQAAMVAVFALLEYALLRRAGAGTEAALAD